MTTSPEYRNPLMEILSAVPDDRRGIELTREQLEAWAGMTLSDEEIEALEESIPNSSIPEAIATMAELNHEEMSADGE